MTGNTESNTAPKDYSGLIFQFDSEVYSKIFTKALYPYVDDERLGDVFSKLSDLDQDTQKLFAKIVSDIRKILTKEMDRIKINFLYQNIVNNVLSENNISLNHGHVFLPMLENLFTMEAGR